MSPVSSWASASQCNLPVHASRFACERPLALPEAFAQQLSSRGSVRGPLEPTRLRADACMLRLPWRMLRLPWRGWRRSESSLDQKYLTPLPNRYCYIKPKGNVPLIERSDRVGTRLMRAPSPMAMTSSVRDLMPRVRCGSFSDLLKLPRSALA